MYKSPTLQSTTIYPNGLQHRIIIEKIDLCSPSRVFHVTTEWVTLWSREQLIQIALAYRKSMSVMKYRCLQNATS